MVTEPHYTRKTTLFFFFVHFVSELTSQERKCICFPFFSNFDYFQYWTSFLWQLHAKLSGAPWEKKVVLFSGKPKISHEKIHNNFCSRMKCIIMNCAHKHELSHNYGSHGMALRYRIATETTLSPVQMTCLLYLQSDQDQLCSSRCVLSSQRKQRWTKIFFKLLSTFSFLVSQF